MRRGQSGWKRDQGRQRDIGHQAAIEHRKSSTSSSRRAFRAALARPTAVNRGKFHR
jgi:hypothetical protein